MRATSSGRSPARRRSTASTLSAMWLPRRASPPGAAARPPVAATPTPAVTVPPSLGAADSFAVLGGTAVTAAGAGSVITGDVGVSPGLSITGFPASATVVLPFATHNDAFAGAAQTAAGTLYANLAAAGPCSPLPAQLNGLTVSPGIYCFAAATDLAANGSLPLDGP